MTLVQPSGFAVRRNGSCLSAEIDCGATDAPFRACCPEGSSCPHSYNVDCCPSSANCTQTLLQNPSCANSTWTLYDNFGFFCCSPDKIGYNATETFSDGCADPRLPPRGAQLLSIVSAGQTVSLSSSAPSTTLSSTPSPTNSITASDASSHLPLGTILGSVFGTLAAIGFLVFGSGSIVAREPRHDLDMQDAATIRRIPSMQKSMRKMLPQGRRTRPKLTARHDLSCLVLQYLQDFSKKFLQRRRRQSQLPM